jgi:hypothetical protein
MTEFLFIFFPFHHFTLHMHSYFCSFLSHSVPTQSFLLPNNLPFPFSQGKRRVKNNFLFSLPFHEEIIISSVNFIVGHLFSFVFCLPTSTENISLQGYLDSKTMSFGRNSFYFTSLLKLFGFESSEKLRFPSFISTQKIKLWLKCRLHGFNA